jgi:predicted outer membrane repeat protein
VIQVAGGEYVESIELASVTGLRVVGGFMSGGDFSSRDPELNETVLRGDPEHAVVSIAASNDVLIEGFWLTGGGGFFDGYKVAGGGVFIDEESAAVSIVANRVFDNAVDRGPEPDRAEGGGIASYGADVKIIGNVVEANRGGRGAGIASEGGVIDSNVVVDNFAVGDHGGGIAATGEITITRNHVEGNTVGTVPGYGYGGGIFVFGSDGRGVLQGNVVTGNFAVSYGSGVFIDDEAHASLVGELYFANECTKEGAVGLFIDSGGPTPTVVSIDNSTITEHDCADSAQGGNAIYVNRSDDDPAPIVTINNSILWRNGGSDLLNLESDVTVTRTISEQALQGEGNTSLDPEFTSPVSADFRLGPASPARGARADGGDLGYTGALGSDS